MLKTEIRSKGQVTTVSSGNNIGQNRLKSHDLSELIVCLRGASEHPAATRNPDSVLFPVLRLICIALESWCLDLGTGASFMITSSLSRLSSSVSSSSSVPPLSPVCLKLLAQSRQYQEKNNVSKVGQKCKYYRTI